MRRPWFKAGGSFAGVFGGVGRNSPIGAFGSSLNTNRGGGGVGDAAPIFVPTVVKVVLLLKNNSLGVSCGSAAESCGVVAESCGSVRSRRISKVPITAGPAAKTSATTTKDALTRRDDIPILLCKRCRT